MGPEIATRNRVDQKCSCFLPHKEVQTNFIGTFQESPFHRIHSEYGPCHLNPNKVNDNHMEELYQATPEELK